MLSKDMLATEDSTFAEEKLLCMDRILEMNVRACEFWTFRSYPNGPIAVHCKFEHDGDKIEIKVSAKSLIEAVDEAYARFTRILGKLPEFDEAKAIEHHPKPVQPVEVPF